MNLPDGFPIDKITFGLLSPDEIKKMAVCKVNTNNIYDERMGSLSQDSDVCVTCKLNVKICPGHFGYIELNEYILHPLFKRIIILFLKCICLNCYRLVIDKDHLNLWKISGSGEKRFAKIIKGLEKVYICCHCKSTHLKIVCKTKDGPICKEYKEKIDKEKEKKQIPFTVQEIKKIFDNISDEDVKLLGFDPKLVHPRNLIMSVFPVLPSCARPYIIADGNICDDDLTSQIGEILKDNDKILKFQDDSKKLEKAINSLNFHVTTFFNNSAGKAKRPTDSQPIKGLKERISGKYGQIRQNNMGKRVNFSARTVIGPDPTLKMGELAIPYEIAEKLTFPEKVTETNITHLSHLVNSGKANFVIRTKDGKQIIINLTYATFKKGTELQYGDYIVPEKIEEYSKVENNWVKSGERCIDLKIDDDGNVILPDITNRLNPEFKFVDGHEILKKGDRIIRKGKLLENIYYPEKKYFKLQTGDIVERQLRNGDIVLLNRQPTLHRGSMLAKKIVIRPFQTLRMNLATTKTFNADFDGDEMNIHAPQSYDTVAELKYLSATEHNMISPQESKPNISIIQDSLLAAYRMTKERIIIEEEDFINLALYIDVDKSYDLRKRMNTIKKVLEKFGKDSHLYTARNLISLILPDDFYYENTNNAHNEEKTVKIYRGVLYEGTLDKSILGSAHHSLIQILHKEYGPQACSVFVDNIQFITNNYLLVNSFSIGLQDCMVTSDKNVTMIEETLTKYYIKAEGIEKTTQNPGIREVRVTNALSQAKDTGMKIAKDAMAKNNGFLDTVKSGSKGDFFNIAQITGLLGQQNILGQRVKPMLNHKKRTLPHYPLDQQMSKEREYESRGFIRDSFIKGLTPEEFFFHACSGREGICDTAMSTAKSGYTQRRIIKVCEDLKVQYDGTVRDTTGKIFQHSYGETGIDAACSIKVGNIQEVCDVDRLINTLNYSYEEELEDEKEMGETKVKEKKEIKKDNDIKEKKEIKKDNDIKEKKEIKKEIKVKEKKEIKVKEKKEIKNVKEKDVKEIKVKEKKEINVKEKKSIFKSRMQEISLKDLEDQLAEIIG